jgi:hypothetical protein
MRLLLVFAALAVVTMSPPASAQSRDVLCTWNKASAKALLRFDDEQKRVYIHSGGEWKRLSVTRFDLTRIEASIQHNPSLLWVLGFDSKTLTLSLKAYDAAGAYIDESVGRCSPVL